MAPIAVRSARASLQRGARRGIEEGEFARIGDAPQSAVEREPREIGGENFRGGVRLKAAVRGLLPQTIANAGLDAARAPAPLVGVGAADADGRKARQADVGLVDRNAHEAGIDHDAHAFDGERRLGDRGGEHDLAPPRGRRRDGEILRMGVERAIERRDVDVGALDARVQDLRDAPDLALPRQEDQDRAAFLFERVERHARDLVLDPRGRVAPDIARRDGIGAAFAFDQRRVSQERAHPRAVERRRHDEEAQVVAQGALRVEREGETEVGVERALVELVEQNGRHPFERGVIEDLPCEHALGDDLDPCAFRHEAGQPHAQSRSSRRPFRPKWPPCGRRRRGRRDGAAQAG